MPKPFAIDPKIMSRIRPMRERDVRRVAQLHSVAMGQSLWAQLGKGFLETLYRGLLQSPLFLGFVYEEGEWIEGFIAGSLNPSDMMRSILVERNIFLGLSVGVALLTQPRKAPRISRKLLETTSYFKESQGVQSDQIMAESLFCSFTPRTRGKRISGHINKVLFDTLLSRGESWVKITTEQDNIGANRQLRSWGFVEDHQFTFYGKEMVTYILNLSESDRVEHVDHLNHIQ